ncbi:MAG: hypothetical protein HWD61_15540 [Parachlamydiaceae bacterium]|nr:MAG: hypothetical protein HWD61_15540 [Parachlamydiaceae bacterium]
MQAEIYESSQIGPAFNYVNQDTLVLLDITSTLYEPSVTMADKRWRTFLPSRLSGF